MKTISSDQAVNLINVFITEASDTSMLNLINYARSNELDDCAIVLLAKGLAESGMTIPKSDDEYCDIPSTGGPSSLSTLICPLFLKVLGNKVLKLGVPGRPAGGIDVLAQIQGYNVNPSLNEINEWLAKAQYIHFLANENFAPLDARLFQFRKANNGLNIPSLVIASLLSKKIAVHLSFVGLDVRVSDFGNFGATIEEAKRNSRRFNTVSQLLGIKSTCFITNGLQPQQPYIGRGEAILAMHKIFNNQHNGYLRKHLGVCLKMALSISSNKKIDFAICDVENAFWENVELQGGNKKSFYDIAEKTEKSHTYTIQSAENGFFSIDMFKLRTAIVEIQSQSNSSFNSDPCGVILKRMPNEYVSKGEEICSYRCEKAFLEKFQNTLKLSFSVSSNADSITDVEVVN